MALLRVLVPNLVGRVLGPVGCQEQIREGGKAQNGQYSARGSGSGLTEKMT